MPEDITQQLLARHGQAPVAQAPQFQMPEDIGGMLQMATENPPESKNIAEAMALMQRYGYDDIRDAMARGGIGNYDVDFQQALGPAMQGYLEQGGEDAATKAKVFLSLLQGF